MSNTRNPINDPPAAGLAPVTRIEGAFELPDASPVQPHELTLDDTVQFRCHPGIACFNACCRNSDVTLTPYDIVRLKRRLNLTSDAFVARYTTPFELDFHGMPGLKLATRPGGCACCFLDEQRGCTVYQDRPVACRYYALGVMGIREKGTAVVKDRYFTVKEPHCLGHDEPQTQTVAAYRQDQGVEQYDAMNRPWRDIIIKKRSGGPTVGAPSQRSLQLFDMCSYDVDSFKRFMQSPSFTEVFDVADEDIAAIVASDEDTLAFAMRFMAQVLFAEHSIPLRAAARERRIDERQARMQAARERHQAERDAQRDVYAQAGEDD